MLLNLEEIMTLGLFAELGTSESSKPIKVLIVDDHPGVRAGIRNILKMADDIIVIGEAGNGTDAIELSNAKKPDLILLDVQLPDLRGDIVLLRIHKTQPRMKVLAVSSYTDREYVQSMLDNGASGYLTKDEAPAMLVDAIRTIINKSGEWISPRAIKSDGLHSIEEQILTKREIDILEQLLMDRSDSEIAAKVGMDEKLIGKYLNLLMRKFEAESLTALKQILRRSLFSQET